jgi:hypothetical protein
MSLVNGDMRNSYTILMEIKCEVIRNCKCTIKSCSQKCVELFLHASYPNLRLCTLDARTILLRMTSKILLYKLGSRAVSVPGD